MTDQAAPDTLPGSPAQADTRRAHILALTSGTGRVGKTFVGINLAAALALHGYRVLVLDTDLGLANLDVLLHLNSRITLHEVFTGRASLEDAILPAPGGYSVLLAGTGLIEYACLTPEIRAQFMRTVDLLAPRYDIILLDTGAGIAEVVQFSVSLAAQVLMLATPEPAALTDTYAAIKMLATRQKRQQIDLVINQAQSLGDGRTITGQLQQALSRFVSTAAGQPLQLNHLGDIPADPAVREAVMRRQLLLQAMPGAPASLAVAQLAHKIKAVLSPCA